MQKTLRGATDNRLPCSEPTRRELATVLRETQRPRLDAGHPVTLIRGDGVGPELVDATCRVLAATGVRIIWDEQLAGAAAVERHGVAVSSELLSSLARTRVGLKGPLATPIGSGRRSFNADMRVRLDLFASVRPCRRVRTASSRPCDFVVIRENHEDLYAGIEFAADSAELHELAALVSRSNLGSLPSDAGVSLKVITRSRSKRVIRYAFEYCLAHARRHLTVGHKANVLVETDLAFLHAARQLAPRYPTIRLHDCLIDSLCSDLIRRPETYDVIVLPNLYGDIVSDIGAALTGGVGVAPSANVGDGGRRVRGRSRRGPQIYRPRPG